MFGFQYLSTFAYWFRWATIWDIKYLFFIFGNVFDWRTQRSQDVKDLRLTFLLLLLLWMNEIFYGLYYKSSLTLHKMLPNLVWYWISIEFSFEKSCQLKISKQHTIMILNIGMFKVDAIEECKWKLFTFLQTSTFS